MNHSKVYIKLNFLLVLKDATIPDRKDLLCNMSSSQLEAVAEIARRVVNGVINTMRRDVQLFRRKRLVLRTLASSTLSSAIKKTLIRRHHSLVPVLLRTLYLIRTILDEVTTAREA